MLSVDIGAMFGAGSCSNIINKETKAVYLTRTNHSKAFHDWIAFNMENIKETDKYKLNLISVAFNPIVPIGDGYHELYVCSITTYNK